MQSSLEQSRDENVAIMLRKHMVNFEKGQGDSRLRGVKVKSLSRSDSLQPHGL